jgi:endoglucanase
MYRITKRTCLGLLLLSALTACLMSVAQAASPAGFEVKRGVNLSHWLSQSGKRGEDRRAWIQERDLEFIASIGYDHVRLPVDEEQLWNEAGEKEAEAFQLLHDGIGWAQQHGLRVIVDLHILRSHHFNAQERPLWTDPKAQEAFLRLWRDLSAELCQYPVDQVAYELMNEPVADNPEDWNRLVAKGIATVREKEPQRVIVVGSNKWQSISTMEDLKVPADDKNILLSFHFYEPFLITHHQASWTHVAKYKGPVHYPGLLVKPEDKKDLPEDVQRIVRNAGVENRGTLEQRILKAVAVAKQHDLPVYCGEWGCIIAAPRPVRLAWYRDMVSILEEHNIGWANWDYKGGFGIRARNDAEPDTELIQILTGSKQQDRE